MMRLFQGVLLVGLSSLFASPSCLDPNYLTVVPIGPFFRLVDLNTIYIASHSAKIFFVQPPFSINLFRIQDVPEE